MATLIEPGRADTPSPNPYVPRILLRHLAETPDEICWTTEGSVVFVDISGFTKLSEKLAKVGKEGAEQVTGAIEACFTDLLAVAYANDGSLIKFGGDALLLLFEEEDHVASACRSAIWMRRTLRDVGRIELPGGAHLQLRMSVGVHTGTYHFFHVGGSHRELVVTGPGWTGTVSMEHVADAGEILLSSEIAALLPPRCIGEAKGPGFLLKREPPGHHAAVKAPPYAVDAETVAYCLSTAVRGHVLAGGGTPEHRQVSIAFVHFDGTDDAIAERGPDAVAADLQELLTDTQAACDEYGVCFLASDADDNGGKLILTAGAPTITGNDEERMLLALRKIADKQRRIPIRIGVNRGAVFAGDIGPWYRRTYTVMGDAVNLAARLMAKATAGQIFATADVLDASGTLFNTIELEPFMVKGKAKPVQAWAVGEVVGSRTRDAHVRLPLVGRDDDLAVLRSALVDARGGHGSLVDIVGEPGIGKTRLIEELHAEHEARVLFATAEAFTSSSPYVIWRALLRDLIDVGWEADDETVIRRIQTVVIDQDPALVPWIPLIGIPLDVDIPLTREVENLAEEFRLPKLHEVTERFLELTMTGETLLHVEDAHLMDGASAELFTYLLARISEHPWLITVTRRDEHTGYVAPEHDRVRRITLSPLAREEIIRLVEAVTEDMPLLPHDVSLVADRAGGNPQFALDLAQVVSSGGMLPASIETAAMARIDALAPADRELVRRTSVLGTSFALRFLPDVLDDDAPSPDDATWERLGEFFADDGEGYVRFRRAVVRDAAYSGLPFRTRRALHAKVASRFEAEFNPDEAGGLLSLHYFLAGDLERAWPYARQAAARAQEQFAHQEAAQLYRRAIDAANRLPTVSEGEVGDLYRGLSDALIRYGELRAADEASAKEIKYRKNDPVEGGRALLKRAKIQSRLHTFSRALWWISRSRSILAKSDQAEAVAVAADAAAFYAVTLNRLGRTTESARWGHRAVEEAESSGNQRALAESFDLLDSINMEAGEPIGEYWDRAYEIYGEIGDLSAQERVVANKGVGLQAEGRFDEAMASYERSREIAEQIGDVYASAISMMNEAEIHSDRGNLDVAERLLEKSVRFLRASGDSYMIAGSLQYLGRVLARLGRTDAALAAFEESEERFAEIGAIPDATEVQVLRAECFVLRADPRAVLDQLGRLRDQKSLGEQFRASVLRTTGYAHAQLGELAAAREAFLMALDDARRRSAGFDVLEASVALTRLARLEDGAVPIDPEMESLVEQLGIVAVTSVPLPA